MRRLLLAVVVSGPPLGLATVLALGAVRATAISLARTTQKRDHA